MKSEKQTNQEGIVNPADAKINNGDISKDKIDSDFGPVIFTYTRTQALEDGQLVDISKLAREAGFKFPVAITCGVHELLHDIAQPGQSFGGRVWDMLMVLRYEIKKSNASDTIYFAPLFNAKAHKQPLEYKLWAKCHAGDNFEPVITVMLINED
jgi:hypothetical protein